MKCCSCLSDKKRTTADLTYQGDTLCAKCYEKILSRKIAEAENNAKMAEIERKLELLTGAKK